MPKFEDRKDMKEQSLNLERARQSVVEELEAINFYQERIDASKNSELKKVLEHNRDEEKEHVAMLIEWIRKNDEVQDEKFEKHD